MVGAISSMTPEMHQQLKLRVHLYPALIALEQNVSFLDVARQLVWSFRDLHRKSSSDDSPAGAHGGDDAGFSCCFHSLLVDFTLRQRSDRHRLFVFATRWLNDSGTFCRQGRDVDARFRFPSRLFLFLFDLSRFHLILIVEVTEDIDFLFHNRIHCDLDQLLLGDSRDFFLRHIVVERFRREPSAPSHFFMLRQSRNECEHHKARITLDRLLSVTVHVKGQQTFFLEDFSTLNASVDWSRVVAGDFVSHEVFAKIESCWAFCAFEVWSNLAVFVDVPLVSFADVIATEHSRAVTTRQHQILIMLGCDVAEKKLFVLKHLKWNKCRFSLRFPAFFFLPAHKFHTDGVRNVVANDIAKTACFCTSFCKLYTRRGSVSGGGSCAVVNYLWI